MRGEVAVVRARLLQFVLRPRIRPARDRFSRRSDVADCSPADRDCSMTGTDTTTSPDTTSATDTTDSSLPLNDARRRASQAFRTSSRPRTAPQPRTMVFDDAGMRTSLRTDRLGSLTVEGRITRNDDEGRLPPDAPPSPPYEAGIPLPRTAAMTSAPPPAPLPLPFRHAAFLKDATPISSRRSVRNDGRTAVPMNRRARSHARRRFRDRGPAPACLPSCSDTPIRCQTFGHAASGRRWSASIGARSPRRTSASGLPSPPTGT